MSFLLVLFTELAIFMDEMRINRDFPVDPLFDPLYGRLAFVWVIVGGDSWGDSFARSEILRGSYLSI